MTKLFFVFALAAHQAVATSFVNSGQRITIVTIDGNHTYTTDQPQLDIDGFGILEICNTGVWITYGGPDYRSFIEIYQDLDYNCEAALDYRIRSTRLVGLHDDHRASSVTFYEQRNFAGESVAFGDEIVDIPFNVNFLATIDSNVQFYQLPNFEGGSICYEIDTFTCQGVVCWDWYLIYSDMPWGSSPRSARAGCDSSAKLVRSKANKSGDPTSGIKN